MPVVAIIVALFVAFGGRMLLSNVVTGTSAADVVVINVVPIVCSGVVLGIVVAAFKR